MIERNTVVQGKLDSLCAELVCATPQTFGGLQSSSIPTGPGVYVISRRIDGSADEEEILYVGQSKSLRDRIFNKHRNGSTRNSVFHRHLAANLEAVPGAAVDEKDYIKTHCLVRWLEVGRVLGGHPDVDRLRVESYLIGVLAPRFGLKVGLK